MILLVLTLLWALHVHYQVLESKISVNKVMIQEMASCANEIVVYLFFPFFLKKSIYVCNLKTLHQEA